MFLNLKIINLNIVGHVPGFSIPEWDRGWEFRYDNNDVASEDYYYHTSDTHTPVAPHSILFTGTFSSGKTIIFNLLQNIANLVTIGKDISNHYKLFDVIITFYYSNIQFEYEIKFSSNRYRELLKQNGKIVFSPEQPSSKPIIGKSNFKEVCHWFENLIFIPSIYDNRDEFFSAVNKYTNDIGIDLSNVVSKNASWLLPDNILYSVKLETNLQKNQHNICTFLSSNKTIKTTVEMLNNSSYDLLMAMMLARVFIESESHVMLIDDFDLIAKTRFIQYMHSEFMSKKSDGKPRQLIGFSNGIIKFYEGCRQINRQSKNINLNPLFHQQPCGITFDFESQ